MPSAPLRVSLLGSIVPFATALGASALTHQDADESAASAAERPAERVDFVDDVRPILAQHCFVCHGPDEATREADLRLDLVEFVVDPDDPFAPVVAGDPDGSELILRVFDTDDPMPPVAHDDPLTEEQKQTLRRWVEQGAEWPTHWAFEAPTASPVPEVAHADWVRDPLDAFVLERIEEAGLTPTEEASREAWLRRVTLDLTGLPPTPDELDAFLADESDDAYETQVDRLLASERYGERMAQDWLDVARYADTSGFQFDTNRTIWKYRDWVIDAFNANKPYDEFVLEQLAGDLLPNPTVEQLVATGFNRNHPTDSDSPAEPDEYRTQYVLDRVHTTATAFMGLTMSCAQCHDHKYDPVSQEDFYSFYAFFNSVAERDIDFGSPRPLLRVPSEDQKPLYEDLLRRIDLLEARMEADDPLLDMAQDAWESKLVDLLGEPVEWDTIEPVGMLSHNGGRLRSKDDGSVEAFGPTPVEDVYDVVLAPGSRTVHALRLEVLPSEESGGMSGRDRNGQFTLTTLEVRETNLNDSEDAATVYMATAQADLTQERDEFADEMTPQPGDLDGVIVYPTDGDDDASGGSRRFRRGGWKFVGDALTEGHEAVLIPIEPLRLNESSVLKITLGQEGGTRSAIARFRISVTDDERIRDQLLPFAPSLWSSIGPFPAESASAAFATEFELEDDIGDEPLSRLAKYDQPVVEEKKDDASEKGGGGFGGGAKPQDAKAQDAKPGGGAPGDAKPAPKAGADGAEAPAPAQGAPKPAVKVADTEQVAPLAVEVIGVAGADAVAVLVDTGGVAFADAEVAVDAVPAVDRGVKPGADSAKPGKGDGPEDGAKKDDAPKPGAPKLDTPDAEKDAPKNEEKKDEAKKDDDAPAPAPQRPRRPARRLAWEEQRTWVDGRSAQLAEEKGSEAWYLVRTIEAVRPRVATLRLDGPDGVRVWLNGEEVFADAPSAAPAAPAGDGGEPADFDADDFDADDFDFAAFFGDGGSNDDAGDRTVRLGFRAGTNELVVKVVYQAPPQREGRGGRGGAQSGGQVISFGGGSRRGQSQAATLTFDVEPEGDDLVTHEIATALWRGGPLGALARKDRALTSPALPDEDAWNEHTGDALAPKRIGVPDALRTTDAERERNMRRYYREEVSTIGRALVREKERLEGELRELEREMPETMVMAEREVPRDTHVFMRGDWRKPDKQVSARVPTVLPPMSATLPRNRLGLAHWLVDGEHPLTARVAVNRTWQMFFGTGFVSTPDDFGIRGERPSHPELLDTLAVEFVDSGWDVKALHRRIVLSSTYRQSSKIDAEDLEADPDNRLLSRGPRQRLNAEMIRDNALAVSGLLVEELGGPSVRPYQAPGLWREVFGGARYRKDSGDKQYRRGLYVYWKRRAPYASMLTFDATKGETCTVVRPETNTPLQALVLLNNPVYVEAAKKFGERLLADADDDVERLKLGFRLCTSREATEKELAILTELLAAQRSAFEGEEEAAKEFLSIGDSKVDDERFDLTELAAWAAVANALLNLDATIHKG